MITNGCGGGVVLGSGGGSSVTCGVVVGVIARGPSAELCPWVWGVVCAWWLVGCLCVSGWVGCGVIVLVVLVLKVVRLVHL